MDRKEHEHIHTLFLNYKMNLHMPISQLKKCITISISEASDVPTQLNHTTPPEYFVFIIPLLFYLLLMYNLK